MAARNAGTARPGGPNRTCQFKLVLLGESAVGELILKMEKTAKGWSRK